MLYNENVEMNAHNEREKLRTRPLLLAYI